MSKALSDDIVIPVKELICEISGFEDGTEPFNHILKYFRTKLKKSDTMYFLNKREIDQNIESMIEKFCFHGFFSQADALRSRYKMYVSESLPKSEMMNRLNMVKLLLCLSESPTKHFLDHPETFVSQHVGPEEEVDWGAYLNEGIEQWRPNYPESSDEDSYSSIDEHDSKHQLPFKNSVSLLPTQIKSTEKMFTMDFKINREELLATIQHSWYNQEHFCIKPESEWREANIGILWENYLKDQVQGLILLSPPSFITEYKVIREILWQLWGPHISSTLDLSGNNIRPQPDVTIASVRSYAFYTFMNEFIPYIELLDYFREFEKSLQVSLYLGDNTVCCTYQSYFNVLSDIVNPVYKKLSDLEEEVRLQETTYTLLKLADALKQIFEPIKALKEIHSEVIVNHLTNSPIKCAMTVIMRLQKSLNFTCNKLEQDLKLTLFLGSLYHYLGLVDSWLMKDDLTDYTGEFVIEKKNTSDKWQTQFVVKEDIDEEWKNSSLLKIFTEKVFKMGRNINFLRLLGKYDIIGDCQESIYDEFIRTVFKKLRQFNNTKEQDEFDYINQKESETLEDRIEEEGKFIFPVVGTEICKTNPDVQKLENLVDIDDGFLVTAFTDFFIEKLEVKTVKRETLFERISKNTVNLFPKTNVFETILVNIIEKRFTVSGLMVKNQLIEDHLLEKQFQFLKHVYLFFDDIIFPFYRRLFKKTDSLSKNWANEISLTYHLHYLFMDSYPEFYDKSAVQVTDGWSLCTDSLSACALVTIDYVIPWPLNIIIKQDQMESYKYIFQFLLKLKWALHTLNHLVFSDLESKGKFTRKSQKTFKETNHKNKATSKLIRLKFCLINILNSLQHFVFGFIFGKTLLKFELDFEKAYDLNSLIESHASFIQSVSGSISHLSRIMLGKDNNNVLSCVKLLKLMWNNLHYATLERIKDCNVMYDSFVSDISPVIFPVYIYDY